MATQLHPAAGALPGSPATATFAVAPPGRLVAFSGQLGVTEDSPAVAAPIEAQVRRAFANLSAELERAGIRWRDVVRFTTYLVGRDAMATFHEVRDELFAGAYPGGAFPPNTTVLVAGLFHEHALVEIDALAVIANGERA